MSISLRQKQNFYDQLGKLLRAGIPINTAIEKLSLRTSGGLAVVLRTLRREISGGASVGDAFSATPLSEMERATLAGLARSGKMDAGLQQLSSYFGALHSARSEVIRRLRYPLFLLHFGVLSLNAVLLVTAGVGEYLRRTGTVLAIFYAGLAVLAVLIRLTQDAGATLPPVDDFLRMLPFLGKVRRSFAVSRFCATYEMQLDAGVNVIESLMAAARSSRSGMIRSLVNRAIPEVRRGGQVGAQLARSRSALPEEVVQGFIVGEETGRLDQTLSQFADEYHKEAIKRIDVAAEWIPRLIYIGIMFYIAWRIIEWYRTYLGQIDSLQNL